MKIKIMPSSSPSPSPSSSSSPSSRKKKKSKLVKTLLKAANASCRCGKPKPKPCDDDVLHPIPITHKPKTTTSFNSPKPNFSSSTHSIAEAEGEYGWRRKLMLDSIAVVKDSNNPYQDFRHSMLQMMFEKEIYSKNDVQHLVNCFLEMNSPCHHGLIIQAFTEIWNDVTISKNPQR